ncbi:hypothetical protein ACWPO4_04890 [Acinetobacter nosocomialis]|uniref:hypothetical protein n=1 Tax=Acinetobacter calcoaceticus/baumannii complex TaxID=909768 RepID=UPI00044E3252|nr:MULTISPECIES: hypothetical protein [Acinetobacter calcoaceticus/baumannii complex]EXR29133.1 hypothetical protein J689_3052 [Acinetobacter sp. 1179249]MBJ8463258.1 hypothetical protein [Acinetobacter nosocomialis]MBP1499124.1 hypothetical protein [Acinetobacter nosocomialis]MCG9289953.1 hypothetical protein [Acinetobacter nosocomialis]
MNFENFDEKIGLEGYYRYIMNSFFPNSNENSFDFCQFKAESRIFKKGSRFFRVRKLTEDDLKRFFNKNEKINKKEFFPPKPEIIDIGRFNSANERVLYLAEQAIVAIKECDIKNEDHFLLSIMSIKTDMSFIHLKKDNPNKLTQILYKLLNSSDRRFYPLINKIYSKLLDFTEMNGIIYDSVKFEGNSIFRNLVIKNEYIQDVSMVVSTLNLMVDGKPLSKIIFKPNSQKKLNKIGRIFYSDNRKNFINESYAIFKSIDDNNLRLISHIENGLYKKEDINPIKIIEKDESM